MMITKKYEVTDAERSAALATGTKHAASNLQIFGNADEKVSPHLKAWIAQPDEKSQISVMVVGLIGQGTTRSLQANWNSPFEQSNLGGMFEKAGGLIQVMTEKTSITTLSSTQVWEGNRPNVTVFPTHIVSDSRLRYGQAAGGEYRCGCSLKIENR